MAYLPGFRHDVFVNYAHGDFERAGTSLLNEWPLGFKRDLDSEQHYAVTQKFCIYATGLS